MAATPPAAYTVPDALLGLREEDVRRKGEQKGTVRRRGATWYIQFFRWEADGNGNLRYARTERKIEGTFRTAGQAQAAGYEQHVKEANGVTRVPQGLATVRQFVTARFQQDHIDLLKKSGRIHYRTVLDNHVLPSIGDVQMRDVTPQMVQSVVSGKFAAGYAPQTLAHIRNVISAIFRHARNLRFYTGQLPTEGVRLPEMVHEERRALTWEQVKLLADALPSAYQPLIILLAQTGLRIGEACGLRWRYANLSDEWRIVDGEALPPNCLLVASNWTRNQRTTLKNRSAWRKIPLTAESWVALMEQWEATKFRGDDHPVFASRAGTPLDGHNMLQRVFKPRARKLGLAWANFHCLRHTAATLADKAGLSLAEKQKILGHATAGMSMHYTHPEIERVRQAMERMSEPAAKPSKLGNVVQMPMKKGA